MIMKKVLAYAEPFLAGKTVSDLVVGISLIGCQLSDGNVGVSYVLREEISCGCSNFPFAQEVIGKAATEIAGWVISGENALQRAIGTSVLTAASCAQQLPDDNIEDMPFGIEMKSDDVVGMVGFIKPLAAQISKSVKKLIIFDKAMSLDQDNELLYGMEKQPELLPQCDIVILSGTTTINGTIDYLLQLCPNAREIVMVGPSTPMFPQGWQDTPVTRLAGSCWDKEHKEEIFKLISLGGGIKPLKEYMFKKAIAVK